MHKHIQPFNIYSIENIDEWRQDFFYPLSLTTHEMVTSRICDILTNEYENIKEDWKTDYRIASKHLYASTFNFIMKLLLVHKMKSYQEVEFVLTNHRWPSDVVISKTNSIIQMYHNTSEEVRFPSLDLVHLDALYHNLSRWRKGVELLRGQLKKHRISKLTIGQPLLISPNKVTLKYVKNNYERSPVLLRRADIFQKRFPTEWTGVYRDEFVAFSSYLASRVDAIFREITGISVPRKCLAEYQKAVAQYMNRIDFELQQARSFFKKLPPNMNLYTGTAKHYTRMVSEAVRERGGKVTGFPHGGGLAGLVLPSLPFIEFSTCDCFACLDEKEVVDYSKYNLINEIEFTLIKGIGESILNLENSPSRKRPFIDLSSTNNLMNVVMGCYYDKMSQFVISDTQLFLLQLDIMDSLLALNKKIIFKNRPKTAYLSRNFRLLGHFDDHRNVEYTSMPFTEILHQADLFIFTTLGSSALYEAMTLTSKPIVLFKRSIPKCSEVLNNAIGERCHVIELYEDERNRLCFDRSDFYNLFSMQ